MIKSVLLSTVTLLTIGSLQAASIPTPKTLDKVLEAEIQKDLAGKSSCFGGKVKALKENMEESYGGRFGGEHELKISEVRSTQYRAYAKYCEKNLDKNLKEVSDDQDENLIVYRQCTSTDTSTNVAVVGYGSATSGSIETESVTFAVDYNVTHKVIVNKDASYHPDEDEVKSWDISSELSCKLIEL
jgi:hypothetical protein